MTKNNSTTKQSENSVKMAQLEADFFMPENFDIKSSSLEISEKNLETEEVQFDFTKQENIQKDKQESEVFSVKNTFMIRQKRDMQNYINAVANEMEVEKQDMQKVLLSYSKMMQLNEKIEKQKEDNPYGLEAMKKKVIEDFVKQQTEANVSYRDVNEKQNKKNARNNRSSKSGKNGTMSRTSQKKKNKKPEKMSITKKTLYVLLGGTGLGFGFLA